MKRFSLPCLFRLVLTITGLLLAARPAEAALTQAQTFNLRAGWNAIWLELTPQDPDPTAVFQRLPIESVWTFAAVVSSVDFIQNINEPVWNRDRWLVHVPTNRVESLNNNLFKILGHRAYLVKCASATTLNVTGTPRLKFPPWAADAYNFRGFPIDPVAPPTFANFFRFSPAHYNTAQQRLEKMYRLTETGEWTLVQVFDQVRSGEAYWVYTSGPSDFIAPLSVAVDYGYGFEFDSTATASPLKLRNVGTLARTATVRDIGPATPLHYRMDTIPSRWAPLPSPFAQALGPNGSYELMLAPNFAAHTDALYETILRVTDGLGTRIDVPVSIRRTPASAGGAGGEGMGGGAASAGHEGLWVGTVTINAVSEAHAGTLVTNISTDPITDIITREVTRLGANLNPTPTGSEFSLRLLMHVDANGAVNLLKDVIQMWQAPTYGTDAMGQQVMETPGRYVLLTDERLIPQYKGAALVDGELVGRRLSTADFPFPSTAADNFLPLSGTFDIDGTIAGSYTLGADDPINPFKHRYHPDHDNLDAAFIGFRAEAFNIARSFQLTFTPTNTTRTVTQPDYGYTTLSGFYNETVSGLHRTDIRAGGPFELRRVVTTPVLNQ